MNINILKNKRGFVNFLLLFRSVYFVTAMFYPCAKTTPFEGLIMRLFTFPRFYTCVKTLSSEGITSPSPCQPSFYTCVKTLSSEGEAFGHIA